MKITHLIERSQSVVEDVLDMALYLRNCPSENIGKYQDAANRLAAFMEDVRAALAVQTQQGVEEDLDARMKAAGMYTIAEMMGVTPLTKWKSNPSINTIDSFAEWLDRKVSEYLTMKAGYDLGDKSTDDELYEWVEAHAAVFGTIRDQFQVVRSALVDVPAVESEPVAFHVRVEGWGEEFVFTEDGASSLIKRLRRTKSVTGDVKIAPLYAHPPRSLSDEGDSTLRLAVAAVLEADTEFRSSMMPGRDGDILSDEIDGLRRVFAAVSTRKGSASITKDADHG